MKSDSIFLEKDLSNKLYGIFLKIGKELGCNFKEEVYLKAIEAELKFEKIPYFKKPVIAIFSNTTGEDIGVFIPDLIVADKIIIEIKAYRCLMESFINQLIKYLEKSKYEIGYLVNFGTSYTQIVRRVFSNKRKDSRELTQTTLSCADIHKQNY